MKKPCRICVRKCDVKFMENDAKMGPKMELKIHQKSVKKPCKKSPRKMMQKRGAKKPWVFRVLGPGVPVRGKEFLPETPGSRFAIANHHHTNNHPANN